MTPDEITTYKTTLEEALKQIEQDLVDIGIHNPSIPSDWIAVPGDIIDTKADENIAADRSEDWQERRSTVATLETRYNNIVRALLKIKNKKYGLCEICNKTIETKRLAINPAARTCITHMTHKTLLKK